jgi:hypothetical protein
MNRDLVRSIAESVRHWAEGRAEGTPAQGDLFGWCAIASAELWRQLDREGIAAELHCWVCPEDQSSAHVYLVVEDHVVDITCTQFTRLRDIPVYIEHCREAERYVWYQAQEVFKTPKDLIKHQKKTDWVKNQIAWSR